MSAHIDTNSHLATQSMYHLNTQSTLCRLLNTRTEDEMRLILLGRTGEGKSALANVLLGAKVFKSSCAMRSVTQQCQAGKRQYKDRSLLVIDTPGLFDTDRTLLSVANEIAKAVGISAPGPHALIIVIKAGGGRYTREAEETMKLVHDIFGGDILRYCIVVFTGEDNIRRDDPSVTLDQWLQQSTESVISLVQACHGRCMAIDTTEKSAEQLDAKVSELISMVNKMVDENGGRVYTNEMLERAEQAYREREEEILRAQRQKVERQQRDIDQIQRRANEVQLEKERLNLQLEAARKQSQQDRDALLAARLQIEEREIQLREQQAALTVKQQEDEQRSQETMAAARDHNRDTVKREEGGIWKALSKYAVPVIEQGISGMSRGSRGNAPNEPVDNVFTLNNHSLSSPLRQITRNVENLFGSSTHHHTSSAGFLGLRASQMPGHHHAANSLFNGMFGPFPRHISGSHMRPGAGLFGGMSRGGRRARYHRRH